MTKFEKLGEVLRDAANLVTPTSGARENAYDSASPEQINMELAYRIGRAISLYRAVSHERD